MPTRSGYTFAGWKDGKGNDVTSAYTVADNMTVYAQWTENIVYYTVSYDANGGEGAPAPQTKRRGTPLVLDSSTPTRAGYVFAGWATAKGAKEAGYQPGESCGYEGDLTLYAVWAIRNVFIGGDAYIESNCCLCNLGKQDLSFRFEFITSDEVPAYGCIMQTVDICSGNFYGAELLIHFNASKQVCVEFRGNKDKDYRTITNDTVLQPNTRYIAEYDVTAYDFDNNQATYMLIVTNVDMGEKSEAEPLTFTGNACICTANIDVYTRFGANPAFVYPESGRKEVLATSPDIYMLKMDIIASTYDGKNLTKTLDIDFTEREPEEQAFILNGGVTFTAVNTSVKESVL